MLDVQELLGRYADELSATGQADEAERIHDAGGRAPVPLPDERARGRADRPLGLDRVAARAARPAGEERRPDLGWSGDQAHRRRQALRHRPRRRPAGARLRRPRHRRRGDRRGRGGAPAEPRPRPSPPSPMAPRRPRPTTPGPGTTPPAARQGKPTQEEQDRFDRYCNQTDASAFAQRRAVLRGLREEVRTARGASSTGGPTQEEKDRYERYCTRRTPSPPTATRSSARTTRRSTPRRPRPRTPRPTTSRPRTPRTKRPRRKTSPTPGRSPSPASTSGSWCCSAWSSWAAGWAPASCSRTRAGYTRQGGGRLVAGVIR